MADEAPVKLIEIGPKGGVKKDGFNLVTERVVAVNPEAKQVEVELLAYDGKTVVLDVDDEALAELKQLKVGDGATIRVVEEGGKRIAKSFRIRAKDPNAAKAEAMLLDLKDTHWLNRKYAAEVLGELKEPRAVRPLVDALTDEVGDVRQRAYDSLIKIGGAAVPSLVPLLVSEEDELRQSVTEIIRKIGKPAVEPLATALPNRDPRSASGQGARWTARWNAPLPASESTKITTGSSWSRRRVIAPPASSVAALQPSSAPSQASRTYSTVSSSEPSVPKR